MKTYKNIYPAICTYENLYEAWRKAARGKRSSPQVAAFEYALTDNLLALETALQDQSYRPGPYRHFRISEPKKRLISAAPFADRVIHHLLKRLGAPGFIRGGEKRFGRQPDLIGL